ncbi:acyl-CoA reductase [Adhaeribacter rhizoryzae]|uniref:Acyl-CoA reductase n=1 Tax=Adhaeribacter rhizoryzae TaxID=2607907 RepID=A0A5M6D1E4_9BACT|nr:acyl-CoA reductase [Adhaeribacter rhizoryzae]KAA5540112.1 acyl-CoA reductase [Adhaeribacter rhizoryzae]
MTLPERINAFVSLGEELKNLSPAQKQEIIFRAGNANSWFDANNVTNALNGIIYLLDKENLQDWLFVYDLENITPKKVGVIMAGNIPMVGFHDFLSVLLSGHYLHAKLSSEDNYLMKMLAERLVNIEPRFAERIYFVELLKEADAIIATGSDNTARYFEYYFSKKPHIIRKNRTSLGILTGEETTADFRALAEDIFSYYGLGCRNVSKVLVPESYSFTPFYDAIASFKYILDHNKYQNNYDYNKSILLVNRAEHFDNGFLLLTPSEQLVSPISVLFYQTYASADDLKNQLEAVKDKTQVIVSADGWYPNSIAFGQAQCPAVWDYADGVDTLTFLSKL